MTTSAPSDFDARLTARLAHLDAAIPPLTLPNLPASAPEVLQAPSKARRRRRRLPLLLAAAAVLGTAGLVGAERALYPEVEEPRLEAALAEIFAGSGCLSAAETMGQIETRLAALGYDDWTIALRPGADSAACVYPTIISPLHEVALVPSGGRELSDSLQEVARILEDTCLNRAQAFGLVSSTVKASGTEDDFRISADPWGPKGGPLDKIELYQQRVAAGCFVYVGSGRDANGVPEFYLWGPWP